MLTHQQFLKIKKLFGEEIFKTYKFSIINNKTGRLITFEKLCVKNNTQNTMLSEAKKCHSLGTKKKK